MVSGSTAFHQEFRVIALNASRPEPCPQRLAGMDCGFEMIGRFAIVARCCCEECEASGDRAVKHDPTERDEAAIVGPQLAVEYGCAF